MAPIVVGAITIAVGVLLILLRGPVSRQQIAGIKSVLGKLGETVTRGASTKTYAVLGVWGIILGIILIIGGLVSLSK